MKEANDKLPNEQMNATSRCRHLLKERETVPTASDEDRKSMLGLLKVWILVRFQTRKSIWTQPTRVKFLEGVLRTRPS